MILDAMIMTAQQCKGARAMLGLTRNQLCELSGTSTQSLAFFENGRTTTYPSTLKKLRHALEYQGMRFINEGSISTRGGPGIRLSRYI